MKLSDLINEQENNNNIIQWLTDNQNKYQLVQNSDLEELTKGYDFLNALEAAGVDNWDGYDVAKDILAEWAD